MRKVSAMAAKNKPSITNLPFPIKAKDVEENYIQVTDKNKSILLVHGRVLYVIKPVDDKGSLILAWFELRPRLKKGWVDLSAAKVVESQSFFVFEDEHSDDYKDFGAFITRYREKGYIYTKKQELLTKYNHRTK